MTSGTDAHGAAPAAGPSEPNAAARESTRPVTIIDVARASGVSRQTVTRALNGMADVSATTRERVIDAARALNYRPNRSAQGLVRGHEIAIGFVVGDLRNPYYPELASELTRLAAEREWGVMLCDLGPVSAADRSAARRRLETVVRRVDAVVGHVSADAWADVLGSLPTVIFGGEVAAPTQGSITIDYRPGIHAALEHFVATGRSRIAMIDAAESATAQPSPRRIIYREYVREHELAWSPASEVWGTATHEGGIDAARRLATQYPELDAAFVFNDVMALGALKGFDHLGRRVPDDVAVIGIDGLDIGTVVTPELTSVALDKTELAQHALELVDSLLSQHSGEGAGTPSLQRTMSHQLVVRESA